MKIKSWFKGFGGLLGGFDNLFDALKSTQSEVLKPVAKTAEKVVTNTTKATAKAVKDTGKAIEKGAEVTGKQVAKVTEKTVNKAVNVGKTFINSNVKAISSLAKGDLLGAVSNLGGIASYGTIDTSGRKQGLVNIDSKKYVNKAISALYGKPDMSTSAEVNDAGMIQTSTNKRSGLLKQLRQAKGSAVGGSYSTVAKNPLGGSSGKTGK